MAPSPQRRVIRATWDANVIVSAMLAVDRPDTTLGRLFEALIAGRCEVVLTDYIVDEVRTTLAKPYFRTRLGEERAQSLIELLLETAIIVPERVSVSGVAPHPKDDPVIAAALSGEARYLVTGEHRLEALGAYQGVQFLSPNLFLLLFRL